MQPTSSVFSDGTPKSASPISKGIVQSYIVIFIASAAWQSREITFVIYFWIAAVPTAPLNDGILNKVPYIGAAKHRLNIIPLDGGVSESGVVIIGAIGTVAPIFSIPYSHSLFL